MTRAAVVGHIEWVDFVPVTRLPRPGEVIHADGAFTRAAGGGGVAAGVLAELGAEVDFFTALGDDGQGRAAADQLAQRGVRMHVAWRPDATRRAMTLLQDGGERTIVTIGERLDPLGSDDLDWDRLHATDGVYVTAGDAGCWARAGAPCSTAAGGRRAAARRRPHRAAGPGSYTERSGRPRGRPAPRAGCPRRPPRTGRASPCSRSRWAQSGAPRRRS